MLYSNYSLNGKVVKIVGQKLTLKAIRINLGLFQIDAAKQLGVTKDTLSRWENGKSYPNVKQIRKIEDVYGVKYDDIIFLPSITV